MSKFFLLVFTFCNALTLALNAQVSITNTATPYVENFNSLASTGLSSSVPAGWVFIETGTGANTTYSADNGGVNSGNTYSYGTTAQTERAFGTLLSGSVATVFGMQFTNNSGTAINSLNISYRGEQWRIGTTGRPDRLDFQYSIDATSITGTGTWTDENSLDFIAPVTTGTLGARDGNSAPNNTLISFEITGLNIPNGTSFWIRWNDFNASGADDGLAVDDLSINFNGTITPPCTEPASQPTTLLLTPTPTTISGSFTASSPLVDEYLVIRSSASTLSALPLDGTSYSAGNALGGGTVVNVGSGTTFSSTGLVPGTTYYFFVFALNSDACSGGPNYLIVSPLENNANTLALPACTTPASSPTSLVLTPSNTTVSGSFTAATGANRYLVVRSNASSLGATPANGVTYTSNQALGNGTVISYSSNTNFVASGLTIATTYYFFVFAANGDCSGEPLYNTASLDGTVTTTNSTTGIPPNYYDGATGLSCGPLKTALFNIVSTNTVELTYTPGVWNAYQTTDLRRNDDNTATIIWDMYSDNPTGPEAYTYTLGTNQCGNYSKEGDCYNREHSFPSSWFLARYPMYSDLHHLFPTDGYVNNQRGNFPYGEVSTPIYTSTNGSKLGASSFPGYSGTVFEPINEYKGDFARAQLYMVTRYEDSVIAWTSNGTAGNILSGNKWPALDDWDIQLMYKWHVQDPVSQKEIDRNNAIYALQNNRNPFIDHPEYVAQVWNCTGLLPVTLVGFTASLQDRNVSLNWLVATETNFNNYEIERSTDGTHFEKRGVVAAQNLSQYNWLDNNLPNSPAVMYRLKMVDLDGKFSYSKIVSVRLNGFNKRVLLYPNPSSHSFTLQLQAPLNKAGTLIITDITGRAIATQQVNATQQIIPVSVQGLPAGRYIITIKNSGDIITESLIITR